MVKKRVLICWELGANYGHLARLLPLAQSLRDSGHTCLFAVREQQTAATVLGPQKFTFVPSPRIAAPPYLNPRELGYAGLLLRLGWGDAQNLLVLAQQWRILLQWFRPDVLVADFSPGAILMASVLKVPVVDVGTAFSIPKLGMPWPLFHGSRTEAETMCLAQEETEVLVAVNAVLAQLGADPISALASLWKDTDPAICTFPELDPFAPRELGWYAGPLSVPQLVADPVSTDPPPKIVAYLRGNTDQIGGIVMAISSARLPALVSAPELSAGDIATYRTASCRVEPHVPNISRHIKKAKVVVSYGSAGIILQSLLCGIPLLLLPRDMEKELNAGCVARLGAGLIVPKSDRRDAAACQRYLEQVIGDPQFGKAARDFAHKHGDHDPQVSLARLRDRIVGDGLIAKRLAIGQCQPVQAPLRG